MKKQLREQIVKRRKSLTCPEVLKKSYLIQRRLFTTSWYQNASCILFYVSYNNEVNTHDMIKETIRKEKKVIVPKTDIEKRTLVLSKLESWDDLCPGSYSILEPMDHCLRHTALSSIDLCIIPGVVFDCEGNRIGHGGGYYDRLLQNKCHAHRIGLAYEFQIVKTIPSEPHDIKVEKIITEERTIDCS